MIKTIYADCKTVLALGKQGENNAVQVIFKLAAWREMYGDGTLALLIQRKGDPAPYAVPVTIDGDTAVWTVSNTDNAVAGYGNAELQYFVGDVLAKSATWRIYVEKALGDATEDVPEPWQTYTEQVLAAGQEAEAARQEWASMTANAETLDPDEEATASYSDGVLSLGIPRGERGEKGDAGALGSVTASVDETVGNPAVSVTYDGTNADFAFSGLKGERGEKGEAGALSSVTASVDESTGTPSVTVTYDGENADFSFHGLKGERGERGERGLQGVQGERGETGATGQPGADGHSPVVTAQKSGTTTTIKVDGVSIATISDGAPGQQGTPGAPGRDGSPGTPGQDGEDGFSPIISTETISGGHSVTITDASGTHSFNVMDGADGASNWSDVSGKPFESIGSGLSVSGGVLSSEGGGGSGEWETVEDITLTADVASYEKTFDPPVKKSRITIVPNAAATISEWKRFGLNGVVIPMINGTLGVKDGASVEFDANGLSGYYARAIIGPALAFSQVGINGGQSTYATGKIVNSDNITKIGCYTAAMLVTGAKIRVDIVR